MTQRPNKTTKLHFGNLKTKDFKLGKVKVQKLKIYETRVVKDFGLSKQGLYSSPPNSLENTQTPKGHHQLIAGNKTETIHHTRKHLIGYKTPSSNLQQWIHNLGNFHGATTGLAESFTEEELQSLTTVHQLLPSNL